MSTLDKLLGLLRRPFQSADEREEEQLRALAEMRGTTVQDERLEARKRRQAIRDFLRAELGREPTPDDVVRHLRAAKKVLRARANAPPK